MSEKARIYNCPVDAVIGIIGGKYKPIILYHLIDHTLRFSELRRFLPQNGGYLLRLLYAVIFQETVAAGFNAKRVVRLEAVIP